ncbi:hypothetical protein KUTeg_022577 [Tegillarca granosa]|uniref:DUF7869 domain-containing protein n=1 Tax=Tegillarca granosa TaxID=220873 RepID=A0ABQ9E8K3_TEGGR|nr:hypothetical protein KUTeg_022577 [Tegillarca granosa]
MTEKTGFIKNERSDESDIDIQDGNNSGFESDESNENSNEMSNRSEVSEIKIKKGRPKGTKRARDKDENESGKAYPTKKQKTKPFSIDVIKAVYCCTALCLCSIDVDSIKALRDHIGSRMEDFASWLENGGVKIIDKPGRTGGRPGTDSESALAWLHFYAIKYAEQQPDQVKLHLPPCLTKGSVYMMYTEEMTEKGIKIISISHFYLLWRKCLNFISIPQQSTFSKCDICTQIKTKLSSTKDKAIRAALQKLRHNHLRKQSLERRKYHKHAMKARLYPEKYVSIIIDGMDQKKTQIPHLLYISSFIAGMWKLRTHLVGAIVHGVGVYGFFDYYQYPHGSNLTIHVLLSILFMIRDSLPEVFCVCYQQAMFFGCNMQEHQIDNYKCKIQFVWMFSVWLKTHSATTLPKLMNLWEQCFTPKPTGILTENVYDVAGWLQGHINPISGHSKPHTFRITKENDKVKLVFKKWTNDAVWIESKGNKELLENIPSGYPKKLEKISDANIDAKKLENDVNKVLRDYRNPMKMKRENSGCWTISLRQQNKQGYHWKRRQK